MRHRKRGRKLGRTASHYYALQRNLINNLFKYERIVTTIQKAKEFTGHADRLITHAKEFSLHHYRYVLSQLQDKIITKKLFQEIAPRFKKRPGGYTRIIKLGGSRWSGDKKAGRWAVQRLGDNSTRIIWELVDRPEPKKETKKETKKKAKVEKK